MSRSFNVDLNLEIPAGNISGMTSVNKFGRAVDGIQITATDIWDRADSAATQQIWTAPTAARLHNISSSSVNDDGSPVGTGARTIRVFGLTSWSAAEVSEDITLNGTSNVSTVNSYVIIHRMKVLTWGTAGPNDGDISATAVTDGTITAEISAGQGQTNMAIYGIPDTQTAYLTNYIITAHNFVSKNSATESDFSLLINESPDVDETAAGFLNKSNVGIISWGDSTFRREYEPYMPIPGPAIIKIQAISTDADTEGSAEFDFILVDN